MMQRAEAQLSFIRCNAHASFPTLPFNWLRPVAGRAAAAASLLHLLNDASDHRSRWCFPPTAGKLSPNGNRFRSGAIVPLSCDARGGTCDSTVTGSWGIDSRAHHRREQHVHFVRPAIVVTGSRGFRLTAIASAALSFYRRTRLQGMSLLPFNMSPARDMEAARSTAAASQCTNPRSPAVATSSSSSSLPAVAASGGTVPVRRSPRLAAATATATLTTATSRGDLTSTSLPFSERQAPLTAQLKHKPKEVKVPRTAKQGRTKKDAKEETSGRKTFPTTDIEESCWSLPSCSFVMGVDEAGRGPLAGPVVAAAVMIPKGVIIEGVNDSKKLSQKRREELFDVIVTTQGVKYTIAVVDSQTVDTIDILQATMLAMSRCVFELHIMLHVPDASEHARRDTDQIAGMKAVENEQSLRPPEIFSFVLFDGPRSPENLPSNCRHECVVKGDSKCQTIAAASILAKVTRDRMMDDYDRLYPLYGFKLHKGYGTAAHIKAILQHGPCPIHRRSFAPVKDWDLNRG